MKRSRLVVLKCPATPLSEVEGERACRRCADVSAEAGQMKYLPVESGKPGEWTGSTRSPKNPKHGMIPSANLSDM